MSMGWLTESALIPKPAVPINVDNSSVLISYNLDYGHEDGFNEG